MNDRIKLVIEALEDLEINSPETCCHCNEEIKGIKKIKVWNGKLLPMCHSCWAKWINGGRK